ncbi:Triacylglycerol lipase [Thalictrum thalictroides]|uniref:Triacylglycerol lipase n=1 Tax=Thalictrum thalictroides TaxID=46969 RepID=A0A7J6WJ11_THATH|nr:Triacylglycerol lipase [Thalictrum thalictroides]
MSLQFFFFTLLVLSLAFLVSIAEPSRARRVISPTVDDTSPGSGLCALSVTLHGYKCQEFEVRTEDGYILSMQRIPEGHLGGGGSGGTKQPVLLQHGVLVDM